MTDLNIKAFGGLLALLAVMAALLFLPAWSLLKHDGRIVIGGLEEFILKKARKLRRKLRK